MKKFLTNFNSRYSSTIFDLIVRQSPGNICRRGYIILFCARIARIVLCCEMSAVCDFWRKYCVKIKFCLFPHSDFVLFLCLSCVFSCSDKFTWGYCIKLVQWSLSENGSTNQRYVEYNFLVYIPPAIKNMYYFASKLYLDGIRLLVTDRQRLGINFKREKLLLFVVMVADDSSHANDTDALKLR